MGKYSVGVYVVLILLTSSMAFAAPYWKDISPRDDEGEFLFFRQGFVNLGSESVQLRILSLDLEEQTATATIMDGQGNIVANNVVIGTKEYTYVSDEKARFRIAEFSSSETPAGSIIPEAAFELALLVDGSIDKVKFFKDMQVGISYQGEVEVSNSGQEAEEFEVSVSTSKPFLKATTTRKSYIVNPVATNQRVQFSIIPQEPVIDEEVVFQLSYQGAIIDEYTVTEVNIEDTSSGFIDRFDLPKEMYKGEKYTGKILFTNNADVPSKMRVQFLSDGFDFETKTKHMDDTLGELLDPHVKKSMEFKVIPLEAGVQTIQIKLTSNGRIVDKVLYETTVLSRSGETPSAAVEIVEEPEVTAPKVEKKPLAVEEESSEEETDEGLTQVTAQVINPETQGSPSGLSKLVGIFVALLVAFLVYSKFFKVEEPQKRRPSRKRR